MNSVKNASTENKPWNMNTNCALLLYQGKNEKKEWSENKYEFGGIIFSLISKMYTVQPRSTFRHRKHDTCKHQIIWQFSCTCIWILVHPNQLWLVKKNWCIFDVCGKSKKAKNCRKKLNKEWKTQTNRIWVYMYKTTFWHKNHGGWFNSACVWCCY